MTFIFEIAFILLGTGALSAGYILVGLVPFMTLCLVTGLFWLLAAWRRWRWFGEVGLLIFVVLAGFGIWIGLPLALMVVGVLGGLLAWDLSVFTKRLLHAHPEDDIPRLERAHIIRMIIFSSVSLSLGLVILLVRVRFTFEWTFLLSLVVIGGITQLANRLRRNS